MFIPEEYWSVNLEFGNIMTEVFGDWLSGVILVLLNFNESWSATLKLQWSDHE